MRLLKDMGFFLRNAENVLELVMMVEQPCEYTKSHCILLFKRVIFIVSEFYFN